MKRQSWKKGRLCVVVVLPAQQEPGRWMPLCPQRRSAKAAIEEEEAAVITEGGAIG
jgi:hypothetical protein